ncbi:putative nuclease HARBI1 [Anthonomus grandis grandis]|uniref:putative nuclease HARBI1 n=1 Tax=Anthonomus grandis grandis TaxID=2921223 RepID=UPI0021651E47|nr:putative nuclease HARBI1 [Anthonomus grandis grandis]
MDINLDGVSPTEVDSVNNLGDPEFQQGVGVDLDVNQSTVSRTLATVSKAIYSKRNNWIKFSNTNELLRVAINEGARGERMLRVIGVIDCTHVKITKPSIHGDEYVNRKGVCSINVQATCNAREMFTSVDASWPGSVHDGRIWRNPIVHRIMYNNVHEAALLGDEGYGVAPWLLTPYKNPTTPISIPENDRLGLYTAYSQPLPTRPVDCTRRQTEQENDVY